MNIDMQYYSAHPEHGIFAKVAKGEFTDFFNRLEVTVIPNIKRLQEGFRNKGMEVIHSRTACLTKDGRDRSWRHKALGVMVPENSKEADFLEELKPMEDELVISKTSSGIFTTNIDRILRNLGMEYLVFVGVVTNQCVETSVREAADWGYRCVLVEDACAALTESLHVAAIRALRDSYAKIRTTEDVLEEIESL